MIIIEICMHNIESYKGHDCNNVYNMKYKKERKTLDVPKLTIVAQMSCMGYKNIMLAKSSIHI